MHHREVDEVSGVVLVVMADPEEAAGVVAELARSGATAEVVHSVADGWRAFDPLWHPSVVADVVLPDGCGIDLQRWILDAYPWTQVMLLLASDAELPPHAEIRDGRIFLKRDVDVATLPRAPEVVARRAPSAAQIAATLGWSVAQAEREIGALVRKAGASSLQQAADDFREQAIAEMWRRWLALQAVDRARD